MLGITLNYACVFFRNLQNWANSGHPDIKVTAESILDISGPIGGYRKDGCGAQAQGGGAAGILWKYFVEYVKIGNTAFLMLWAKNTV